MEASAYQRMAAEEENHWWYRGRRSVIATLVEELELSHCCMRILEVGCGSGGNLGYLKTLGAVDALEPNNTARLAAEHKSGLKIMSGTLPTAIGVPDHCYNLIGLFDVLEHIEDDVGTLKTLGTKLAPGGSIVITVPAHPWLWSMHDVLHHHHRRYTRAGLAEVIAASGLEVVHLGFFNSILYPLALAQRLAARAIGPPANSGANFRPWLNAIFYRIFALERFLIGRVHLPTGLSLYAVMRNR